MMRRIIVVGTYGSGETVSNGQINKVRDYYRNISSRYGEEAVRKIDIGLYKRKPFRTFVGLVKGIRWCDKIVLLLCGDGNGIKLIFPLIIRLSHKYRKPVFLSVVGGGMLNGFSRKERLIRHLKSIDSVYVETKAMKRALENAGVRNAKYAPVFSKREGISESDIPESFQEPYRMCTYARVIKEKGISDAIDAIMEVNKRFGRTVCVLDVYGDPIGNYAAEFDKKKTEAGACVICNPLLNDSNAISELSRHYLLLFPTYYKGEGFPIALIESMKAGLPVVATDWHFNSEIIEDGRTGRIYKRNGIQRLSEIVYELIRTPETVHQMRVACIKESQKYEPDSVLKDLYQKLEK